LSRPYSGRAASRVLEARYQQSLRRLNAPRKKALGVSGIGEQPSPDIIGVDDALLGVVNTQRKRTPPSGSGNKSKTKAHQYLAAASAFAAVGSYASRRSAAAVKLTQAKSDAAISEMALDFERAELEESFQDKAAILAERTAQRERATRYDYAKQGVSVDSDVAIKAGDYEKKVAQDDYNALRNRLTAQQLGLDLEEVNIGYNREVAEINSKYEKTMATIGLVNDFISSGHTYFYGGGKVGV